MTKEIWKPVPIPGLIGYEISNFGRISSPNYILRTSLSTKGYPQINLKVNNKGVTRAIHRLVALAFIVNLKNKPQVNHKDGNKENNHVDNLEWVTNIENMEHATKNELKPKIISLANREEIKKLWSTGEYYQRELGHKFNVSQPVISEIVNRKRNYDRV